jgi:hypothetical protein
MDNAAIQDPSQQLFLSYLNLKRGICITYPSNWIKEEGPIATGFQVLFRSPLSGSVNVFVEPLSASATVEQYYQGCLIGESQQGVRPTILEQGQAAISGQPALRRFYTGTAPSFLAVPATFKPLYLQYFIVSGSKGYVVTYTATAQEYDKFLPTVQQMIGTLQVK